MLQPSEGRSCAQVAHPSQHHLPAGDQDGTALEMAFSKKKIEERKAWLRAYEPGTFLDHTAEEITYHDFVNKVFALSHTCLLAAIKPWRQPCKQESWHLPQTCNERHHVLECIWRM